MLSKKISAKKSPEIKISAPPQNMLPSIKIPTAAAVLILIAVSGISFYLGSTLKSTKSASTVASKNIFAANKTGKPVFDFYVMSFCPYGNQIENTIRPIFDLLGNKADIHPRYIFEKISGNLTDYCKNSTPDPANCETYVKNSQGQLKDVNDCKQQISKMATDCKDESKYLKIGENFYTSLHGRMEANQDVREICAYNLSDDKKAWWNFVGNVNQNCTAQNADTCWEEQAKKAGLDTAKITECFNKDAAKLIDGEIALTTKFKVQGSPTLIINEQQFPPETAYTEDGKGSLAIGKKTFTQDQFRTSDAIKEAVCASFKNAPKECKTEIKEPAAQAAGSAAPASCN